MKIFYAVQVSNTTKLPDGTMKWLLKNDACVNIMRGIVIAVLKKKPDWQFVLKVPFLGGVLDVADWYELFPEALRDNISFYEHNIPCSPVTSRFHFDFDFHRLSFLMKENLKNIDVMINDENTHTMSWKVVFDALGLQIPMISTNYFFDTPLRKKTPKGIWYFDRQVESFLHSEIAAFQCDATLEETVKVLKWHLKGGSTYHIMQPRVWGVGCSASEILDKSIVPLVHTRPVVYFGNRITDTAGRYTNWDDFASGIGKLRGMHPSLDFASVMLDPTRKVSEAQQNEINSASMDTMDMLHLNRQEYLQFIRAQNISCNLFVNEIHGGVTHAEAMLAGNIVICPKVNNYKLKIEKYTDSYPFFVKHKGFKIDTTDLAKKIHLALTMPKAEQTKWRKMLIKAAMENETYESASARIIKDLSDAKKMGVRS